MSTKLSPNFTLEEMIFSQTAARRGISNVPGKEHMEALKHTAAGMEQVRALLGNKPIQVSSGYRSPALNKAIGGSTTSQHSKGEAVDFSCAGFGTPLEICHAIRNSKIAFDQLIFEGTWVHISFSKTRSRKSVLTAHFGKTTTYSAGLPGMKK